MTHIKCENCGEEFPEEEIENHRLRCIYTIKDKEMENLIPCEICNQLISFETYHQHLLTCYEPSPPLNLNNFPTLGRETSNSLGRETSNTLRRETSNTLRRETSNTLRRETSNTLGREPSNTLRRETSNTLGRETSNTNLLSDIDRILHNANLLTQHIRGVNNYLSNEINDYENFLELDGSNELLGVRDVKKVIEPTKENGTCLICTDNISGLYKTKCGHLFCKECIEEWFKENRKCPVCMKEY